MPLPHNNVITFELTLPSNKRTLKYRPFLVEEQKILLMALEGQDEREIVNAIRQIVFNCLLGQLTLEEINKMPLFDLEYVFLKVRAKSVGEVVTLRFKCVNDVEGGKCGVVSEFKVNLESLQVDSPAPDANKIDLGGGLGLVMDYPNFECFTKLDSTKRENLSQMFDLVCDLVHYVYDTNQIYDDFTHTEMVEFLNTLNNDQYKKILDFLDKAPKIEYKVPFVCKKCGYAEEISVKGLVSFFE